MKLHSISHQSINTCLWVIPVLKFTLGQMEGVVAMHAITGFLAIIFYVGDKLLSTEHIGERESRGVNDAGTSAYRQAHLPVRQALET